MSIHKYLLVSASVFILLSTFYLMLATTHAAITPGQVPNAEDLGVQKSPVQNVSDFVGIVRQVVVYVYTIFFIIAVLFIILAAFGYLTAADNAEKVKTARKQLIYAAIAIAIALLAVGAEVIIKNFLTTPNSTGITAPSGQSSNFPPSVCNPGESAGDCQRRILEQENGPVQPPQAPSALTPQQEQMYIINQGGVH